MTTARSTSPTAPDEGLFRVEQQQNKPTAPQVVTVTESDSDDEADRVRTNDDGAHDGTDQAVASVVYSILVFFGVLVVVATIMIGVVVHEFGFLALLGVLCILFFLVLLASLLDRVMKEDAKWKPIRRKIHHWQAIATAAVLQEVRDFQLDWHEHLLLTDGSEFNNNNNTTNPDNAAAGTTATTSSTPLPQQKRKRRGGRSVLFKIVKPLLKIRPRRRRRQRHEQQQATSAEPYVPPVL